MVNGHGGMKVLKARNEGQDQNFRIKQLKKARYKKRRLNQKSLTLVSKPSPERVMKSCLKCLKLEAAEMDVSPVLMLSSTNRRVDHFHPTRYLSHLPAGIFYCMPVRKIITLLLPA